MSAMPATPVRSHGLAFDIAAISEQGPRPENQDAFTTDGFESAGILAVADGMGGERGGRLAADTALGALLGAGPIRSLDAARRAARAADQAVARAAQEDPAERAGMGCALAVLALAGEAGEPPQWIGAHVGDVRILSRSPDGAVRLETRDHTPAFGRWEAGEIGMDEIPDAEGANRLQRAVGRGGEADVTWLPARAGWVYLLISDGVTKAMRIGELGDALAAPTAADACALIRSKVLDRGPDDNFTALVVRILGGPAAATAAADDRTLPQPVAAGEPTPVQPSVMPPPPRRSNTAAVLAALLALLALGGAGYAVWTASTLRSADRAGAAATEELRTELDSVRAELARLRDPFGTTASPDSIGPPAAAAPAPNNPQR